MRKLGLTIAVLGVAAISFFISDFLRRTDSAGTITVVVVDQIDDVIVNDTIEYDTEDTLFDLLNEQYDLACGDNQYKPTTCDNVPFYGRIILSFEDVETDWLNTYIAIYVDDEYSTLGIDDITLEDGVTYRFEFTEVGEVE